MEMRVYKMDHEGDPAGLSHLRPKGGITLTHDYHHYQRSEISNHVSLLATARLVTIHSLQTRYYLFSHFVLLVVLLYGYRRHE